MDVQAILTAAIEATTIIGFGAVVLNHIRRNHGLLKNIGSPVSLYPVTESIAEVAEVPAVHTPDTQVVESVPAVEPEAAPAVEIEAAITDLDIDTLTLRQTREVVKAINATLDKESRIRQKVNGADVPYRLLQAQIKRHLEQRPEAAQAIAEVAKAA